MLVDIFRKIFALLRGRERVQFYLLMGMIVISGIADTVGVAAILPFLAVLSDPTAIDEVRILGRIHDWLQPADTQAFLFFLGLVIFALIVVGTAIKLVTMYALARFSHMRKFHIGQRLLAGYLRQPYDWFLSRHSSDLVKTALQEADQMVGQALVPAMRILSQAVSVLFLLVLLILVEPMIALSVLGVLGVSYGAIFVAARRMLGRLGEERVVTNTQRFRIANEALGGVKDVKLMGLEETYMRAYRPPARANARTLVVGQVVGELPRYALEAITFGGMVALILVLLQQSDGALSGVLPVLGLFAVAGLRLLPAVQNIYHSFTSIRVGQAVLKVIHDDLMALEEGGGRHLLPPPGERDAEAVTAKGAGRLPLTDALVLEDVAYGYPGTTLPVLDGLSLEIRANTTVGIVGGTGAGKTTAIDVILGLLRPSRGQIRVDGTPLTSGTLRAWQNNIGYVPQQIFLIDDTVAANIAFGVSADRIDMGAVERAARLARLHDFVVSELPGGYDTSVGERGVRLSGGQRQRIGIARALYHDPDVLILDEATSALDTLTETAIMEAVATLSRAKTIVMIAHRLSTVEGCDRIFLLDRGHLAAQGTYAELVSQNATFRAMARGQPDPETPASPSSDQVSP